MAIWTSRGFIGQMFTVTGAHVPPPPGVPSPVLWGDAAIVKAARLNTLNKHAEGLQRAALRSSSSWAVRWPGWLSSGPRSTIRTSTKTRHWSQTHWRFFQKLKQELKG